MVVKNRAAHIERNTNETKIKLELMLEAGLVGVRTGIGFFDHMLTSFAVHGDFGLLLETVGDVHVDGHHTVEDTGLALGLAFRDALGDKSGIRRFGNAVIPMDEALCSCAVDICNRPFLVFNAEFTNQSTGEYDCCLTKEFFYAFCMNAGVTMHINLYYGDNDHHKCEAIFKSAAHALKQAVELTDKCTVLSTKGTLSV